MLLRVGRLLARVRLGVFTPPPPGGDGTQWDFQYSENSGHLLTCGVM